MAHDFTNEQRNLLIDDIATMIDDFSWVLPMHENAEINKATDDAACEVLDQIAKAVRKFKREA